MDFFEESQKKIDEIIQDKDIKHLMSILTSLIVGK